jgi:hypothetical protein
MPSIYEMLLDPAHRNRLFTDYGFDPRGNNEIGTEFSLGAQALYPEFSHELDWMANYQGPQQRSLIESLINSLNDPGAQQADYNQYAHGAYEDAANSGNLLSNQLRGMGYGSGATGGAVTGQYQNAQRGVNQFRAQQMSPQARLQRLMASMQALQSNSNPAINTTMGFFNPVEQRHQQNQSEVGSGSAWNSIMQGVGMFAGQGGFNRPQRQNTGYSYNTGFGSGRQGFGSGQEGGYGFGY